MPYQVQLNQCKSSSCMWYLIVSIFIVIKFQQNVDNFKDCSSSKRVSSSSGTSNLGIFTDDCTDGWTAPEGRTGSEAELIIDMGCRTKINTIEMRNLDTTQGTRQFSIHISQTEDGPWDNLITGTLAQETSPVSTLSWKRIPYSSCAYMVSLGMQKDADGTKFL